jgi:DNA integrity scanning protein DisA with diadenylate cyclase activity
MRDLVIQRLTALIEDGDSVPSYGVPRYFDCEEDEYVTNVEELTDMSDEELLEMFETVVGFLGFQG